MSDREARADGQGRELIDRVAAGAPVRQLLFVKALGHKQVPFARFRRITAPGVELTTIDAHRATEAASALKGRLNGVAGKPPRDRLEKC